MTLKTLDIPIALNTSKDNLVDNFFVPLLQNAISYDRGVGYFSTGWIKENFIGMKEFAQNGGKARWITSPILSKEDWDAALLGNQAKEDEIIKKYLVAAVDDLSKALSQDTLIAFAWMIADEIIQFKIAKPRNKLTSEYHAKVGIFTDREGNSLSFDGSYNDSINGLFNFESIKVFRSWDQSFEYVEQEKELFEKIWSNKDPNIETFDIPDAVKANILKLHKSTERPYLEPEWITIKILHGVSNPEIPIPSLPSNLNLREYQNKAIDSWFLNNHRGIFEMATGTGKTITALATTVKLFDEIKKLIVIIICPYIHLAQQWKDEAEKFGFRPILAAESKKKWLNDITQYLRDFHGGRIDQSVIITTNSSFLSSGLREILFKYDIWDKVLLIADEMHHCGTQEMLRILPEDVPYRLGLSATPIRDYDEFGSEKLLDYFGEIIFKFDLLNAISQGFLTPYFYYPYPVHMEDDEFEEYILITRKLNRMYPDPSKPMSEAALLLAIKRSRILNNSRSKINWIRKNIKQSDDIKHTLFYVGDQIFDEILSLIGNEKQILVHEFTHRQNLRKRKELITKFAKGEIQAFVAMKCLDEGVDVPPTRTAYFLASSSVPREFIQRRGRILRNYPGKKFAIVYDLISVPPIDYIIRGKFDENYKAVRSAIKREYKRIREFSGLAENKYQALDKFLNIAEKFDLLDV